MTSVIHHYSVDCSFEVDSIGREADACKAAQPARDHRSSPDSWQDYTVPGSVSSKFKACSFPNTQSTHLHLQSKELTFLETRVPFALKAGLSRGGQGNRTPGTEGRWDVVVSPVTNSQPGGSNQDFGSWVQARSGEWLYCTAQHSSHHMIDVLQSVLLQSFTLASLGVQVKMGLHCHSDSATWLRLLLAHRQKRRKNKGF